MLAILASYNPLLLSLRYRVINVARHRNRCATRSDVLFLVYRNAAAISLVRQLASTDIVSQVGLPIQDITISLCESESEIDAVESYYVESELRVLTWIIRLVSVS